MQLSSRGSQSQNARTTSSHTAGQQPSPTNEKLKGNKTRQKTLGERTKPRAGQRAGTDGATGSMTQAQDPALLSSSPPRKVYFLTPKDDKL